MEEVHGSELKLKFMKRTAVHKYATKQQFLWPDTDEKDSVNAGDILCRIPLGPRSSGSKTRALFEFPDAADIQMMFDADKQ